MRRSALVVASLVTALMSTWPVAAEAPATRVSARMGPIDELLASLPIPRDYTRVRASDVAFDRQNLLLIRYERADDRNSDLGGEHVSVLVDRWGRLKGFTRMDLALRDGVLPSGEEAEAVARAFLARHASDLAPAEVVVTRVAPHEQSLKADDVKVALAGMKVKMRRGQDGPWLWVTVGPDRNVMSFERDVVWSAEEGVTSPRWLSDEWIGRALERLEGRGA